MYIVSLVYLCKCTFGNNCLAESVLNQRSGPMDQSKRGNLDKDQHAYELHLITCFNIGTMHGANMACLEIMLAIVDVKITCHADHLNSIFCCSRGYM